MVAFATRADVEALRQRAFPAGTEAQVDRLIELCSGIVLAEAGQPIGLVSGDVVTIAGSWGPDIWLPQWPVTEVTNVTVNGVAVASSDWELAPNGALHRISGSWGGPDARVAVVYSHGFTETPEPIKMIVAEMVRHLTVNPDQIRSEGGTEDQYTIVYPIPADGEPLSFGFTGRHREMLSTVLGSRPGMTNGASSVRLVKDPYPC